MAEAKDILEILKWNPNSWMALNKQEVEEFMELSGGFVINFGRKYWVSFRPAWKRLSAFVRQRSNCKDGDYYVCLVDSRIYSPHREWD